MLAATLQVLPAFRLSGICTTSLQMIGATSLANGRSSDIVYAQLPGTSFIVINSLEIAQEVLSKHANINSGRRLGHMVMREMGCDWIPAFMKANTTHAKHRAIPKGDLIKTLGLTIIELAYGRKIVREHGVEMIAINVEGVMMINEAMQTVWAVDHIPLLRYVPSWFPGAQFK
ncbi:hypothetical protein PIIN_11832 [Serendipita indica DSM 11827]|uniref:Uncharacterized protein n=1 Tax=Serendipita indica (strain DSM 11827) TaxID=1109443 RepID=G4T7N1_SERID|nr:hypothetical protein PIIN_11832 [Serendipita indica DSM 11827]